MLPRGTNEEVELFNRINLFITNATQQLQLEDKLPSNQAGSYFLNYGASGGFVCFLGSIFLLRRSRASTGMRIMCYTVSSFLGVALGLRMTNYAKASSFYMDLKTPLGDYAREQAYLLLPDDHSINQKIEEFNKSLEPPAEGAETPNEGLEERSAEWNRELYRKQRYDKFSAFGRDLSEEESQNIKQIRKARLAQMFSETNLRSNSRISILARQSLEDNQNYLTINLTGN